MIEDGKQVSIEYTLKLDDGSTADSNVDGDPLTYQQGGGQILPALEKALAGMEVDETRSVSLSAEQGYGEVNPEARQSVPLSAIPEEARKEGTVLVAQDDSGNQQMVKVHEVGEESAVLDFNHPLAGQSLHFEVKVLGID